MPEDQLSNLPPEVRQMVMTGMTALMNAGGPGPAMMGPGVMMDMANMMGPIGMGMGMNGDMGMGNAMMQMQDGPQQGVSVGVGGGTPEQVGGMMQDGFSGGQPGPGGMMNMGMGGDFSMQVGGLSRCGGFQILCGFCRTSLLWDSRCIKIWMGRRMFLLVRRLRYRVVHVGVHPWLLRRSEDVSRQRCLVEEGFPSEGGVRAAY